MIWKCSGAMTGNSKKWRKQSRSIILFLSTFRISPRLRRSQGPVLKHNSSGVFVIKPEGFDEPFEVFCENDVDGGGWTVIQRRVDGSINFDRSWSDYKEGFGFLRSEFWIGNQKLSFLTNQKKYQLRIDFENSAGSSFFATYEAFRISDEFSKFRIVSVGKSTGTIDSFIETCPSNMVFKNCSCQTSCANPDVCEDTAAQRMTSLVSVRRFYQRTVVVYVNDDCTERCSCEQVPMICDSSFRCDANAVCEERSDTFGCPCREGFEGTEKVVPAMNLPIVMMYIHLCLRNDGVYNIKQLVGLDRNLKSTVRCPTKAVGQ
ncbi:hypothetical protein BSL78_00256 [Apostichopus japonicus]|uniref:Fibrinogen C-terminal domain-containing protein n=1 Tax=Stichopus japonicus TaxID=307972 RepID=A0A2G8LRE7_STIJA|nr:hypothetical protein BSL78_00256 [Apostichopus japonicus]